jgi:hypothetical protein
MRDTIEMAREAGAMFDHMMWIERDLLPVFQRFEALVRADEREVSLDAVLQVIKELRPALVLTAFADKDNAWVLDKVKESVEKLKEKSND